MDELKWEHLTDIQGRMQAELLKTYFQENGIEVEMFQEAAGQSLFPTTLDILGLVQIFVPKEDAGLARQLLDEFNNLDEGAESEEETEE